MIQFLLLASAGCILITRIEKLWNSRLSRLLVFVFITSYAVTTNAALWECGERSNLPQDGKNYCAAGDFRQADTTLDKLVKALKREHKDSYGDAKFLKAAQDAFTRYRDQQCAAETRRIESMPFHAMILAQCQTRITNERIDELKRMLRR